MVKFIFVASVLFVLVFILLVVYCALAIAGHSDENNNRKG